MEELSVLKTFAFVQRSEASLQHRTRAVFPLVVLKDQSVVNPAGVCGAGLCRSGEGLGEVSR